MGGLRALCCSKGDRHNDDQDTPPTRPTQRQSEKETQKTPGNVKGDDSLVDVKQNQSGPRDLWKEAYDQLDADAKKYLRGNRIPATDAINEVIKDTETKRDHWEKGGLRIKRENGDDISLRESADKIIGAATKAKDVISTIVSFDPTGHGRSYDLNIERFITVRGLADEVFSIFRMDGYFLWHECNTSPNQLSPKSHNAHTNQRLSRTRLIDARPFLLHQSTSQTLWPTLRWLMPHTETKASDPTSPLIKCYLKSIQLSLSSRPK